MGKALFTPEHYSYFLFKQDDSNLKCQVNLPDILYTQPHDGEIIIDWRLDAPQRRLDMVTSIDFSPAHVAK